MTLEERVDIMERDLVRLRRRNLRLWSTIIILSVGFAIPTLFKMTAFRAGAQDTGAVREIRARRLVLEDETGNSRVVLDGSNMGMFLSISSAIGIPRIGLAVTDSGPVLAMHDEVGRGRALLFVNNTGPNLKLFNESAGVIWSAIK